MPLRPELIVAGVLVAAGGTALGASLADDTAPERPAPAAVPSDPARAEPSETAATEVDAPVVLRVRTGGRTVRLPASRIGFAYCARRVALCAAVRRSDERKLSPRQRRAVRRARAKLRERERREREALQEDVLGGAPPPPVEPPPAAPPPPVEPPPAAPPPPAEPPPAAPPPPAEPEPEPEPDHGTTTG